MTLEQSLFLRTTTNYNFQTFFHHDIIIRQNFLEKLHIKQDDKKQITK